MSSGKIVLISIALAFCSFGLWIMSGYNSIVSLDAAVEQAVGNVDTAMQRRLDLIPNLVSTVKGYAKHESDTLKAVIEARAAATQVKLDPKNLSPEAISKYTAAQGQLSAALGKLMMVQEQYPNLKADKNFSELMVQLEGTENRIKIERDRYNAAVTRFNITIRSFPSNIINGMFFNFTPKEVFKADQEAKTAPKVNF